MPEPREYSWSLTRTNIREIYEAAQAINAAAPAAIDETWQTEGTVQIPIKEIIRLRRALR